MKTKATGWSAALRKFINGGGYSGWTAFCCLALLSLTIAGTAGAATVQVQVGPNGGLYFEPAAVTIAPGDTVEWVWAFTHNHTVTSGTDGKFDGLFNSSVKSAKGTIFSFTFPNAGVFQYFCSLHADFGMTGNVEVKAPPSTQTSLANISTRLPVQTGDNALIGGFIVTGTQPKKVIIRAIGPSLSLTGKLQDPVLQLFNGSTLLESNDNWGDSPNKQAIIDSTVAPSHNLESAIVRTLPANSSYTAVLRGVNDTTGIGVVEAYDLDRTVDSKLANISTRGVVQTDPNVLIAGTIVLGQTAQKVILRAIGPSLSVAGKLADPTLEFRDSNGALLQENDNWKDSPNKQAIIDSTVPPTNDLESAIVATLPANGASYTAIVRGANGTSGIAVVEVYALQ